MVAAHLEQVVFKVRRKLATVTILFFLPSLLLVAGGALEKEAPDATTILALAVLVVVEALGFQEQVRAVLAIHHQHPLLREITVEAMEGRRVRHIQVAAVAVLMLLVPMLAVLLAGMVAVELPHQFLAHL